jgi:hypothetical protein
VLAQTLTMLLSLSTAASMSLMRCQVTSNLTQEFIRIRPTKEKDREAITLSLITRTFKTRVVVRVRELVFYA